VSEATLVVPSDEDGAPVRLDGAGIAAQSLRAETDVAGFEEALAAEEGATLWTTTGEVPYQRLRSRTVHAGGGKGAAYQVSARVFPGPGVSTAGLRVTFRDHGTAFADVAVTPGVWQTLEATFAAPAGHAELIVFVYPATDASDGDDRAGLRCATAAITVRRVAADASVPAEQAVRTGAAAPGGIVLQPFPGEEALADDHPILPVWKGRTLMRAGDLRDGEWSFDSLSPVGVLPSAGHAGRATQVTTRGASSHQRVSRVFRITGDAVRCHVAFSVLPDESVTAVGVRLTAGISGTSTDARTVTPNRWQRLSFAFDLPPSGRKLCVFLYPATGPHDDDPRAGATSVVANVSVWLEYRPAMARILGGLGSLVGFVRGHVLSGRGRLHAPRDDGFQPVGRQFGLPKADLEFVARFWRPLIPDPENGTVPLRNLLAARIVEGFKEDRAILADRYPALNDRQSLILYVMLRVHGSFASYVASGNTPEQELDWLLSKRGNCSHHTIRIMIVLWALGLPSVAVTIVTGQMNGHIVVSAHDPANGTAYLLDATMNVFACVDGAGSHFMEEIRHWPSDRRSAHFSGGNAVIHCPFWHRFVDMSYFVSEAKPYPLFSTESFNEHHYNGRRMFYRSFLAEEVGAAGDGDGVIRYDSLESLLPPETLTHWQGRNDHDGAPP